MRRRALASLMALAISAMHYTAMAGLTLMPHETVQTDAPKLSQGLLAIIVSVVAFVVSGLFLLTLIPGGRAAEPAPAPASDGSGTFAWAATPVRSAGAASSRKRPFHPAVP